MIRNALLLVAVGLMVAADSKDDAKKELAKFEGKWAVISMENAGQKEPEDMLKTLNPKVVFKGDAYEAFLSGNSADKGTVKIDASKTPKTVDIMTKDMVIPAIYELKDDELKVCYDMSGKERPKEFKTAAGTMQLLAVYKKQK